MKYIVILGDGMADYRVAELDNKTPLEYAHKPNMDKLASKGICGLVRTVPKGMPPGSDTANLSAIGYDPKIYYSGRSPLEAVSMGIELELSDVTYRCNTVTISDEEKFEDCVMIDHSCDEISTEESSVIIRELGELFGTDSMELYSGVSYRHCLVMHDAKDGAITTPPHDILDKNIAQHLPKGQNSEILLEMTLKSREILKNHPINISRKEKGLNPVSCLWFWGEGRKPALSSFEEKYNIKGSVISAVDLIKGIGLCAGLRSIDVPGATGNIHTNFEGKAQAAIDALLGGDDFVYVHIEAPDECGHRHEVENKPRSIELIDQKIVAPIVQAMREAGEDFSVLILPDHPTPLCLRTHTDEPVPFVLYRSYDEKSDGPTSYNEFTAEQSGVYIEQGHTLLDKLILEGTK